MIAVGLFTPRMLYMICDVIRPALGTFRIHTLIMYLFRFYDGIERPHVVLHSDMCVGRVMRMREDDGCASWIRRVRSRLGVATQRGRVHNRRQLLAAVHRGRQ